MHISIEGIDGVGKTTTSKIVAKKLNYIFVEKSLHYLFDEKGNENYIKIRDKVNQSENRLFTSWFYGLNNIYTYEKFSGKNIVTDRHFLSNFAWSGTNENKLVYKTLVSLLGKPTLTVILYADSNCVLTRITKRNPTDKDVIKIQKMEEIYKKMRNFCLEYDLPFMEINTSNLTPEETSEIIISKFKELTIND